MNCQDIRDLVNRMNDERSPCAVEAQQMLAQCANTLQQLHNLERVWRARHAFQTGERVVHCVAEWELAADELAGIIGESE